MKTKTINHVLLGGDVVDTYKVPQRKPNKTMSGEQMLLKAVTGIHKVKTENEKLNEQANKIINKLTK